MRRSRTARLPSAALVATALAVLLAAFAGGAAPARAQDSPPAVPGSGAPPDDVPRDEVAGDDEPQVVSIATSDGLTLKADWFAGAPGMPAVVALHMYRSDRSAWRPLLAARPAGYGLLAIDLRGHGGSRHQDGADLGERVEGREPALFNAMWQDAAAALRWVVEEGGADPQRLGLLGASVGCSVAIDTARRDPGVAAVCALTPGAGYLGVPTLEHLKTWPGTPLLVYSSREEAKGGADPIAAAVGDAPFLDVVLLEETGIHGTRMFGAVEAIEDRIWTFFTATLGAEIADGRLDAVEAGDGERFGRWVAGSAGGIAVVQRSATNPGRIVVSVAVGRDEDGVEPVQLRFAMSVTDGGQLRGVTGRRWNGTAWTDLPAACTAAVTGGRTDDLLEVWVPWRATGEERGAFFVPTLSIEGEAGFDPGAAPGEPDWETAVEVYPW